MHIECHRRLLTLKGCLDHLSLMPLRRAAALGCRSCYPTCPQLPSRCASRCLWRHWHPLVLITNSQEAGRRAAQCQQAGLSFRLGNAEANCWKLPLISCQATWRESFRLLAVILGAAKSHRYSLQQAPHLTCHLVVWLPRTRAPAPALRLTELGGARGLSFPVSSVQPSKPLGWPQESGPETPVAAGAGRRQHLYLPDS